MVMVNLWGFFLNFYNITVICFSENLCFINTCMIPICAIPFLFSDLSENLLRYSNETIAKQFIASYCSFVMLILISFI